MIFIANISIKKHLAMNKMVELNCKGLRKGLRKENMLRNIFESGLKD